MVDNTTMYLTWEPPPAQHLNGPLNGYKVNYTDCSKAYSTCMQYTTSTVNAFSFCAISPRFSLLYVCM